MRHMFKLGASTLGLAALSICSIRRTDEEMEGGGGYNHADHWPAVFYGPDDQSEVFKSPLEVPEGWHDHPSKVGDKKATTDIPGYKEAVAAAKGRKGDDDDGDGGEPKLNSDGVDPYEPGTRNSGRGDPDAHIAEKAPKREAESALLELPPIEDLEENDLDNQLTSRKVKYNSNWTKERKYDLLRDHLESTKGEAGGLKTVAQGNRV